MPIISSVTLWYSQNDTLYVSVSVVFNSRTFPGKHRTGWSAGTIFQMAIHPREQLPGPSDLGRFVHT